MQTHTPQPGAAVAPAILGKVNGLGVQSLSEVKAGNDAPALRRSAYGLPCAKCNMYYEADLQACPICKSPQRVSATSAAVTVAPVLPSSASSKALPNILPGLDEAAPAPEVLEEERERFLKELKAQIYQAANGRLRPRNEIAALWAEAGLNPATPGEQFEREVIFYCGSGWRSSLAFFYAYMLGYKNIRNYSDSWSGWSTAYTQDAKEKGVTPGWKQEASGRPIVTGNK